MPCFSRKPKKELGYNQDMNRLHHNDPLNKWTLVLTETLPDSRGQVNCDKHLLYNLDQIPSNVTLS